MLSVVGIIFSQSCQREDDSEGDSLDPVLLRSSELEEYIIAGADLQQSLNVFQAELSKVDFSKLEFVENEKGDKVMHLPVAVDIEGKMRIFDEKKKSLLAKYPLFVSLSENGKNDYFRTCVWNSLHVNSRLLELGINMNQPMTKGGTTEQYGSMDDVLNYLAVWVNDPDYVEVVIIVYKDGRIATYIDDQNTAGDFAVRFEYTTIDNKRTYYYPDYTSANEVAYMAHTHTKSHNFSDGDKQEALKWPGLEMRIYI